MENNILIRKTKKNKLINEYSYPDIILSQNAFREIKKGLTPGERITLISKEQNIESPIYYCENKISKKK